MPIGPGSPNSGEATIGVATAERSKSGSLSVPPGLRAFWHSDACRTLDKTGDETIKGRASDSEMEDLGEARDWKVTLDCGEDDRNEEEDARDLLKIEGWESASKILCLSRTPVPIA